MTKHSAITLTARYEARRTVFARGDVLAVPRQIPRSLATAMIADGRAVAGAVRLEAAPSPAPEQEPGRRARRRAKREDRDHG